MLRFLLFNLGFFGKVYNIHLLFFFMDKLEDISLAKDIDLFCEFDFIESQKSLDDMRYSQMSFSDKKIYFHSLYSELPFEKDYF